jgi:aryl-alcohol dehydrogenase-like predicted oxidoreductase
MPLCVAAGSVERADALKPIAVRAGLTMSAMALRFILSNPVVSMVIPGMRKSAHVQSNLAASEAGSLPKALLSELRAHRWERKPIEWSH